MKNRKLLNISPLTRCKDFELLSPLIKLNPNLFSSSDKEKLKLNKFILALALIFNDLKGLLWVMERLKEGKPPLTESLTPYRGQWSGFNNQYIRLIVSLLWELLTTIDKNDTVLHDPEFKNCIKSLSTKLKKDWNDITSHALGNKKGKPITKLGKFLMMIRNNNGFHYYSTDTLFKGYEIWKNTKSPSSEFAGASLGKNMAETRFYFADAACEMFFNEELKKNCITLNNVSSFINQVNQTIRFIVDSYLEKLMRSYKTS